MLNVRCMYAYVQFHLTLSSGDYVTNMDACVCIYMYV